MWQVRKTFACLVVCAAFGAYTPINGFAAIPSQSSPIAITSDDKYVWVVNPNADLINPTKKDTVTVHQVLNDSFQKVAEITVGAEPMCVALTPDDKKAYVTNMRSSTVSVINAQTFQVIKTIPV